MLSRRDVKSYACAARRGFTLIELLVVISIIAILVALTATAAFSVRRNMQKQNAEATLQKLDQKLLNKQKEMRDRIQDDIKNNQAEAPTIVAACNGNKEAAKAIMLYARMRQQFPMTFAEAKSPFTVCGHQYRPSPAFASLPNTPDGDIDASAACLLAALGTTGIDGVEQQIGASQVNAQKVFIDGLGQPIGFNRLGYDGGGTGELNTIPAFDPFYPNKNGAGAYRDLSSDFGATFNNQVWLAVRQPSVSWLPAPSAYPGLKNHTAFCFSAGLNRQFAEPSIYDGDNLLSYRLRREGARGD